VRRDPAIEVDGQLLLELVGVDLGRLGEGFGDLVDGAVKTVDDRHDLGAQARRDEDCLVDVALTEQRAQYLAPLVFGHGDAFEQVE